MGGSRISAWQGAAIIQAASQPISSFKTCLMIVIQGVGEAFNSFLCVEDREFALAGMEAPEYGGQSFIILAQTKPAYERIATANRPELPLIVTQ